MQDVELYRQLLGLSDPWRVDHVELSVKDQRVDVYAWHTDALLWPCPECGTELPVHDHAPERSWRHLDSCGFATYLHARTPRVACADHGVRQVRLPWSEPHSRFTALFEAFAIDVLKETDVSGACRILRITWDEAWAILERAVARGLARKEHRLPALLGVDEKAVRKGQDYFTLVSDLEHSTIEYVCDERRKASLDGYFAQFSAEERAGVKAVAMDMWEPFANSVRENLPNGDDRIVFDRFHVMSHMGTAVDTVRKTEHRELLAAGSKALSGTEYFWLYSEEHLPDKHKDRFSELRAENLRTGRAWAIKESLRVLWHYVRRGWAMRFFNRWFFWATHSRLKPVVEVAWMIKRHLNGIMNYFSAARITNAAAEGLNSKIQTVKKMAFGFRNREHFKTAIFFHCGGLNLYPLLATH